MEKNEMSRRGFIGKLGMGVAGLTVASLPIVSKQAYALASSSIYNVLDYTTIQDAITAASSAGGGTILFPTGVHTVTSNLTFPMHVDVEFINGAYLDISSGVTVTINGGILAGFNRIFSGSGNLSLVGARIEQVYPEWWGDGGPNDAPAIQKAINAFDIVFFRNVTYNITSTVTIPQTRKLQLIGSGFRNTTFNISASITGLSFLRDPGVGGTIVVIRGIRFIENNEGKTATGIAFKGNDHTHHDNWLRVYDCSFYGFSRAVHLKFCGNCFFNGCYAQRNNVVYFLERDASFIWFEQCMNLDNRTFIYADDTLADGISNGIFIHNCSSVLCETEDIRIVGWQGVYITGGGGTDLGGYGGGTNAIYLGKCQDFAIRDMWVASDPVNMTNRTGIQIIDSHSGVITGCSIVNNTIGIRIDGNSVHSTRVAITDNKFEGNILNDILFGSYAKAVKVMCNHFMSTVSRTATNYEVYANTGGSDYNIIKNNTFKGANYSIIAGTNSIVNENIFSVPN
ncbi:twin-arginine translocation signal domain-containing protein [Paenibacillus eucommiae]|uniref:Pectate lyase superfamily protein domain-containing protein n=1 Tax=Paenibacillus eucommiae TaxID=1355755 RepID=A0ABS4J1I9_9BACL|nr:twin-arginine translocation signal domain-containing protein [Paenibacillus eucommiae]MBP1993675.1 hypothetical protein [Paenibacillus eucommiae]